MPKEQAEAAVQLVRALVQRKVRTMANTDDAGPKMRVALIEKIFTKDYDDGPEQDASELLADLRHYCDAHGLAFHELDRKGHDFYLAESLRVVA
jgi:hypothetical protein